jgi:hypothetical protein
MPSGEIWGGNGPAAGALINRAYLGHPGCLWFLVLVISGADQGHQITSLGYLEAGGRVCLPGRQVARGLESLAITRVAWRFDTLTQRCRRLGALCSGLGGRKGPHRSSGVARAARDNFSGP